MKNISVLIVTFNSQKTIKTCLDSLSNQNSIKEIIVVDNASFDKTTQIISNCPSIRLIKNSKNLGFAKANNIAAKKAKGEYLLFLNPDTKMESFALSKMIAFIKKNPRVGIVGPNLVSFRTKKPLREISKFPSLLSETMILLRFHRIPFLENIVYPPYDYQHAQEVEHLMGAALLIRKKFFTKIGKFDENFFLWFEDTDLLKRIKDKGFKIVYFPQAKVYHLVGHSTKQVNFLKRQTIWNQSLLYYFKKHHGLLFLVLMPFVLLGYITATLVETRNRLKAKVIQLKR